MYITRAKSGIVLLVIMTQHSWDDLTHRLERGDLIFGDGIELIHEPEVHMVIDRTIWNKAIEGKWTVRGLYQMIPGLKQLTHI